MEKTMTPEIIEKIKLESVDMVREILKNDLDEVILYGSCSRGDYTEDSDVDIALITCCNREESEKFFKPLAKVASDIAMKYLAIVNFVCLPSSEFIEKKSWYHYFKNIDREGIRLYGKWANS